jgi:hypothetical protein
MFLGGAAAVGFGTTALEGCGAAMHGEDAGQALLERLERGLAHVEAVPAERFAEATPWSLRPEHPATVLRMGLRSLVVADISRSATPDTFLPAALTERLASEVPRLEQTVGTYHALLTTMPPAARRRIDRRVRAEPDTAMDIAEQLDAHARAIGVAGESRLVMRSTATNLAVRMRRQSAGAVLDAALDKTTIALARSPGARRHAVSEDTFALVDAVWQSVEGSSSSAATPPPPPSGYGVAVRPTTSEDPTIPEPTTGRWNARWGRPGDQEIEIGNILMPFGLITCTVLTWVGLGILIGGISQNNNWDGRPDPTE